MTPETKENSTLRILETVQQVLSGLNIFSSGVSHTHPPNIFKTQIIGFICCVIDIAIKNY